jgi:hypothetical protein
MQEMKAYTCEEPGCKFAPTYQVLEGTESRYFCADHYADFQHTQVQANTKQYCELCGNPSPEFFESPKFGDADPSKRYQVCVGCRDEQEELAAAEFAAEEEPPVKDDDDDRQNLDDTKYDEF